MLLIITTETLRVTSLVEAVHSPHPQAITKTITTLLLLVQLLIIRLKIAEMFHLDIINRDKSRRMLTAG